LVVEAFFAVDEVEDFFAAVDLEAVDLEAVDFDALDFDALDDEDCFAGAFFAVDVEPVDFDAPDFDALDDEDFFAGAFFAVDFDALDFEVEDFFAADEVDDVDFDVDDFFAGAFFVVEAVLVVVVVVVAPLDDALLRDEPGVAAAARPFTVLAGEVAAAAVSFGSFFAPEITFLRSAPGVNFGTAFFLVFTGSPVRGLRTVRAARTRFSNEPKPVMATFSPRATSRVMVSSTDSSACAAALRLPSNRAARVSISWDLFTGSSLSHEQREPDPVPDVPVHARHS